MLRREVVGFLEESHVCPERTEDIRLAVSEALSNVVIHAYRDREHPGDLEVSASCVDDAVQVVVRDCGSGMGVRDDSPGLGLGLPVIEHTSDRYEIECPDGGVGTEIRMQFDC